MTPDPLANCERLRNTFENREAIYVERGALRVKVTNIRANAVVKDQRGHQEVLTIGFPGLIDLDRFGLTDEELRSWTIIAGNLSTCSDHTWSTSSGLWSLFFGSELVQKVVQPPPTFLRTSLVSSDTDAFWVGSIAT